jgi:cellulose synthase (UDP-forming)
MKNYKKYIYYFSLITTIIYIVFRIFFTLPTVFDSSLLFAIIVLLIEIIDAVFFAIYTLNILVKDYNTPIEPKVLKKDYPELDVFIATIN